MSGSVWGILVALAGLALAAVVGRTQRRKWRPWFLGGIIGFFGVSALQLAGTTELTLGVSAVALIIYGGLVGAVAEAASA